MNAPSAALDRSQLDAFRTDGYLVVDDVLDPDEDIAPIFRDYEDRLEALIDLLVERGDLVTRYEGLPFTDRMTAVWIETRRDYAQWFDITLPGAGVRADTPIHLGPSIFRLLTSPRLLDVVGSVLGPEIVANPVQHVRIKLPRRATEGVTRTDLGAPSTITAAAPWHQDNGVYVEEADDTDILTVWLPINEATIRNGCLQVYPRSHTDLVGHCMVSGIAAIPDTLLPSDAAVPLPMRPGSVLIMDKRTIHGSTENLEHDQVRMSFDLRYGRPGEPTGRPSLDPCTFLVRSERSADRVVQDPSDWASTWLTMRARLAQAQAGATEQWAAPRWDPNAQWCA